jgi:hypothetical protein
VKFDVKLSCLHFNIYGSALKGSFGSHVYNGTFLTSSDSYENYYSAMLPGDGQKVSWTRKDVGSFMCIVYNH